MQGVVVKEKVMPYVECPNCGGYGVSIGTNEECPECGGIGLIWERKIPPAIQDTITSEKPQELK